MIQSHLFLQLPYFPHQFLNENLNFNMFGVGILWMNVKGAYSCSMFVVVVVYLVDKVQATSLENL